MLIKLQIKSIFGKVLFEYEKENNTFNETVEAAVAAEADLRYADLSYADLSYADLSSANLRSADLRSADLSYADLSYADLSSIRNDLWDVLLRAIPEIQNLKKALIEGRIDGSTYEGYCACLCGTLMHSKNKVIVQNINNIKDSSRPIERFFLGINKGDTPETNQLSKIALDWIIEFEGFINMK